MTFIDQSLALLAEFQPKELTLHYKIIGQKAVGSLGLIQEMVL